MKKIILLAIVATSLTSCVTVQKQYVDGKVVKDSTKVFVGVEFRKGK
jgi:hypothetical protein